MAVIQGIEELEARLSRMSLEVQRKVLLAATKEGGEIIRKGGEDAAPVLSGVLRDNETVSTVTSESNAYYVLLRIGPNRRAFYGGFDEFGTAFMEAEPWLGPSFQRTKGIAEAHVAKVFKEAVER